MQFPALITVRRAAALALAATAAAPSAAHAAPKSPAPKLTIETAQCATGVTAAQRSLTVTALALARRSGDRVALRFRAHQRGHGEKKWGKVATLGGLGVWEVGAPGTALRYTKLLTPLAEDTRYRLTVEARALGADGKVSSRTARRTVHCNQPRQSADVRIRKVVFDAGSPGAQPFLAVTLRNAGTQPAAPSLLTLRDEDGATLRTQRVGALKGGGTRVVRVPVSSCDDSQELIVEPAAGADGSPATDEHRAAVRCPGGKQAKKTRR